MLPGQPGTKKLQKQHGDRLVCVRYRYDTSRNLMVKTVELIVDEQPWQPNSQRRSPPNKRIPIRVGRDEHEVKKLVKAAGGRWNYKKRVWELAYKQVVKLGLTDRIVQPEERGD